jgi:hypothetical protein
MCAMIPDDPEERSKICECFGIQLDETTDVYNIPSFFLFGWCSMMGKLVVREDYK